MGPAGPELERNTSDLTACTDNDLRHAAEIGQNESGAESGALLDVPPSADPDPASLAEALKPLTPDARQVVLAALPPDIRQAVLGAIRAAVPGDAEGDPR